MEVSSKMMLGRGRGRGGMGSSFGRGGPPHGDDPRAKDKAMRSIFGKMCCSSLIIQV